MECRAAAPFGLVYKNIPSKRQGILHIKFQFRRNYIQGEAGEALPHFHPGRQPGAGGGTGAACVLRPGGLSHRVSVCPVPLGGREHDQKLFDEVKVLRFPHTTVDVLHFVWHNEVEVRAMLIDSIVQREAVRTETGAEIHS